MADDQELWATTVASSAPIGTRVSLSRRGKREFVLTVDCDDDFYSGERVMTRERVRQLYRALGPALEETHSSNLWGPAITHPPGETCECS